MFAVSAIFAWIACMWIMTQMNMFMMTLQNKLNTNFQFSQIPCEEAGRLYSLSKHFGWLCDGHKGYRQMVYVRSEASDESMKNEQKTWTLLLSFTLQMNQTLPSTFSDCNTFYRTFHKGTVIHRCDIVQCAVWALICPKFDVHKCRTHTLCNFHEFVRAVAKLKKF